MVTEMFPPLDCETCGDCKKEKREQRNKFSTWDAPAEEEVVRTDRSCAARVESLKYPRAHRSEFHPPETINCSVEPPASTKAVAPDLLNEWELNRVGSLPKNIAMRLANTETWFFPRT